jgi:succinate-acetate transporter protein
MAVGNTFGATALSSYGGFWIAFAIILTPGGFQVGATLEKTGNGSPAMLYDSIGLFLMVSRAFKVYIMKPNARIAPIFLSFNVAFLKTLLHDLTYLPGIFYLHLYSSALHLEVVGCLFLSLLLPGHGVPDSWNWPPAAQ